MTEKQQRAIEAICAAAEAKSFSCEVVFEPRDAGEGAQIAVASDRAQEKIGIAPDGYPLVVSSSGTWDGKLNLTVKRAINKVRKGT